jgi:hypothetical protein
MVYQLSYTASILESFGILSGFPVAEAIWRTYAAFAIPKISESTVRLRGALYYLKDLTPEQAGEELGTIEPFMPVLFNLRTGIEEMDNPDFQDFKQAALDFFDTVNLLFSNLQDLAAVHASYELSQPVLAVDWDRQEDDHWDTY